MKNNNTANQVGNQNIQFNQNKPAPEIRDNLDSRKSVEQNSKGDNTSHNRKTRHGQQQKEKK